MRQSNRPVMSSLLVSVIVLMCSATFALAQAPNKEDYPKFEIFAGYSALGDNTSRIGFTSNLTVGAGYAKTTGFETSVTRNFTRHIGLKADFSAHFKNLSGRPVVTFCNPVCITATQDSGQLKTRVYNFLAGPEFKARNSTRFTPFVYALGGAAHTSAQFSTPGPPIFANLEKGQNGFAMALGGGLEIRATKRVSIRGSMDYNPVFIQDSATGTRDFLRISLGVLFH